MKNSRIPLTKTFLSSLTILLIIFATSCSSRKDKEIIDEIVIENAEFRFIINSNGTSKSLVHKASGQECLIKNSDTPLFAITQDRPYDNEHQLAFPANRKTFSSDSVYLKNDKLIVHFELIDYIATINLKITDDYIGFLLEKLEYHLADYGVKRKTRIDEFTLLQLPIKEKTNFGEWLNVMWDENVAVNLLGANSFTKIDSEKRDNYRLLRAGGIDKVRLEGIEAALITSKTSELFDRIDKVEKDYNLPPGVESRRSNEYKNSYYELRNVTVQNIDEHIEFAKLGGFRQMVIYYTDFAVSAGHFNWKSSYPNGIEDLQEIVAKIESAGLIAGIHIHYNKAGINDPYVTPVPDRRLNIRRVFTLAKTIDKENTVITVEENPSGCTLEDGRRILKIGNELISYEGYTTSPPFQFYGCRRGALNTYPNSAEAGFLLGLLDVDTWPVFVRFNQNTDIQAELAERFSQLYEQAGFKFIYFDGAEDVPPPYWYNVSKAQLEVYDALKTKPLFSEGACKSHFSWHILTRGNAFDIFRPEVIKEATREHPLAEAKLVANDFTGIDFGWIGYISPGENTIGIQPDMLEYITSWAAGWNSVISLIGNLSHLKAHPRTNDNLEVIRIWEEAKANNILTEKQKAELQNPDQEHILLINENGEFELHPYSQITNTGSKAEELLAFIFEREQKTWVVYWHISGDAKLNLQTDIKNIKLYEKPGMDIQIKGNSNHVQLPANNRKFAVFNLPISKVLEIFE